MARLTRGDCAEPGLSRRRRGRGFEYLYVQGPIERATLDLLEGRESSAIEDLDD